MSSEISPIGPAAQTAGPISVLGPPRLQGVRPDPIPDAGLWGEGLGAAGSATETRIDRPDRAAALSGQDQRMAVAADVRETDAAFSAADALLASMQKALAEIVKRYPPYGQDAPERVELINQAIGLKKQLEALAYPARAPAERVNSNVVEAMAFSPAQEIPDEQLALWLNDVTADRAAYALTRDKLWADRFVAVSSEDEQASQVLSDEVGKRIGENRQPLGLFAGSMSEWAK